MSKTFIIGRSETNPRCIDVKDETGKLVRQLRSSAPIPIAVSRSHVSIEVADNGLTCTVRNLKDDNTTFIDNVPFKVKQNVHIGATLALSNARFLVKINEIIDGLIAKPEVATHSLKAIYENYVEEKKRLQRENLHFNNNRMLFITFGTFFAVIVGLGLKGIGLGDLTALLGALVSLIVVAALTKWANRRSDAYLSALEKLKDNFERQYVCPCCGRFIGDKSYNLFKQELTCNKCGVKYVHGE